jgi:hypothetical protein
MSLCRQRLLALSRLFPAKETLSANHQNAHVAATFLAVRVCLLSFSEVGGAALEWQPNLSRRSLLFAQVSLGNSLGDSKRGKNMSNMLSAICNHFPKASFALDGQEPV